MVVKTEFTKQELVNILKNYNLDLKLSKPFKRGYVQTNILLKTNKGNYVLRYYEHRSKEYVLFELNILNYFHKHKYPCAMPIKNIQSKFIGKYRGKYYIIYDYISGRHLKKLNKKQFHELIKYSALLHNISINYKPQYFEHRESKDKKFILQTAKEEAKRNKEKGKERYTFIKERLNLVKLPETLPKGIIHGDFDKANIKFTGNKITGILDFDDACYTYLIYDIGMLILYWAWFYYKKLKLDIAREIITIYNKYRKLSQIEKNHIYDALQWVILVFMAFFIHDKWKGTDLYEIMKKMLFELDNIGKNNFYKEMF